MAGHLAASDIDLSTIRIFVIIVRADPGLRRAGDFDTARIAHNCAWPIDVVLAIDTKYASTFVSGWSLSVRGHGADRDSSYCGQEVSFHPVFSRKQCADLGAARPLVCDGGLARGVGPQYRDGNFLPPRCKGQWVPQSESQSARLPTYFSETQPALQGPAYGPARKSLCLGKHAAIPLSSSTITAIHPLGPC